MSSSSQPSADGSERRQDRSARKGGQYPGSQRGVGWLNNFFRKIVGPAQVDNTRPGGYFEDETLRHQQLDAMGLQMRTDANGHSYVVKKGSK
ncbi:hypothetical protein [Brevibacterium linens]|uniref:Uncharacterized protein n=2 Tax=Brevibacterium linens TaxID=1703 RepID=A0A2H1HJK7_BRELN|nr:hypothetical protein [Brevibacterium linens]SMX62789.1 hypothetical protein BLIN9172_00129 [Brevibacterium linens ATCC 9172]SMX63119.1 hypothetical protein BLIN101_00144 [Brevibacterium linens]